jgi:hypothetical protein
MRNFKCFLPTLVCLAVFISLPASTRGGESATNSAPQQGPRVWVDIQPGTGLKEWTRVAIPPTNHLGRAQWHAEADGMLVCDGDGGHEMLRFDRELADCVFHVEFCFTPVNGTNHNYNSGVFIRNSTDGTIWHQAQLTSNGGYLFGNTLANGQPKRFKLSPTEARMKTAGEWNIMDLTARGKVISVRLNGADTCVWTDCEVPKGYIALESEGFRIEFRNLKLKEIATGDK